MTYESRRQKRLQRERELRINRNRQAKRLAIFVLILAIFFVVCWLFGNLDKKKLINLPGTNSPAKITDKKVETAAQKINNEIEAKLKDFNSELSLPKSVAGSDVPAEAKTAVVMHDLSGKGRGDVNYNGDVQFTSASTYKLYVSYAMIHDVETGRRNWSSIINSTTWNGCLTKMIINSDNGCPETYINSLGYTKFNQIVSTLGVSSNTVFAPYNMRTTASDLAIVLDKIYSGKVMSNDNKNKLIELMKSQAYREGIPSGVGESDQVADKVGFLDALLHDAGIVYSNKGDYSLVIMTNGESWQYISKVTSFINGHMNQ